MGATDRSPGPPTGPQDHRAEREEAFPLFPAVFWLRGSRGGSRAGAAPLDAVPGVLPALRVPLPSPGGKRLSIPSSASQGRQRYLGGVPKAGGAVPGPHPSGTIGDSVRHLPSVCSPDPRHSHRTRRRHLMPRKVGESQGLIRFRENPSSGRLCRAPGRGGGLGETFHCRQRRGSAGGCRGCADCGLLPAFPVSALVLRAGMWQPGGPGRAG